MIDVPTIITLYLLIGLFLAGFSLGSDAGTFMCVLCLFLWPLVLFVIAGIVVLVTPVAFGHWVGEHVKRWL